MSFLGYSILRNERSILDIRMQAPRHMQQEKVGPPTPVVDHESIAAQAKAENESLLRENGLLK